MKSLNFNTEKIQVLTSQLSVNDVESIIENQTKPEAIKFWELIKSLTEKHNDNNK